MLLLFSFHMFITVTPKMLSRHVMDTITMDIVYELNFHVVVVQEIIDRIVTMIGTAIIVVPLQNDRSTAF